MNVLHLLRVGGIGGIEILMKNIASESKDNNIFCFTYKGGIISEEIKQLSKEVIELNAGEKFSIKALHKLVKICKHHQIDIVNVHHMDCYLHMYFLLLSKFYPKAKYVITLHSCAINAKTLRLPIKIKIKLFLLKRVLKKSCRIIAVSDAVITSYHEHFGVSFDKMVKIYNGISKNQIEMGSNNIPMIKDNTINLLYIGRVVIQKGIINLIKVLKELQNDYNVTLTVVGDGYYMDACKELAKELEIQDKIKFVGFDRDLDKYYRNANVFVYPSICREALGISIIDAMAYGLPCVGTNLGGIPELISNGINGYLANDTSIIGLYLAIVNTINLYSSDQCAEVSRQSKKTACDFCISNTITELERVYKECLYQKK